MFSLSPVLGCGTVCQLTLFRVIHFLVSVENLKHFCLGSHVLLFGFSFSLWTLRFLARDSIYAIARYMPLPVRLSVTRVDQSKTIEVRITQLSPQSSPMTLVS